MNRPSPLLDILKLLKSTNPTRDVATRLAERFDYVTDIERVGLMDQWPSRDEVVANLRANDGRLRDDCDGFAFAAAYALHDLGVGARVVIGACETNAGHMVCEDEHGSVIDNRYPGRVLTWRELEIIGYRSWYMNALDFEAEPGKWERIAVSANGCREYA
jgi:hypothetical protein